jgi:hypothetical protein
MAAAMISSPFSSGMTKEIRKNFTGSPAKT